MALQRFARRTRPAAVPPLSRRRAGTTRAVVSIECELDVAVSAAHLPDGSGEATGRAAFHVADWQATTDGSEHLGPVYAKYRECLVLLEAIREAQATGKVSTREAALAFGHDWLKEHQK